MSYATGLPDTAPPGSSTKPRLVWAVLYNDVPTTAIGGGGLRPSGAPLPSYTYVHCQFGLFIDATTGRYIGAEQGCPDFSTP